MARIMHINTLNAHICGEWSISSQYNGLVYRKSPQKQFE